MAVITENVRTYKVDEGFMKAMLFRVKLFGVDMGEGRMDVRKDYFEKLEDGSKFDKEMIDEIKRGFLKDLFTDKNSVFANLIFETVKLRFYLSEEGARYKNSKGVSDEETTHFLEYVKNNVEVECII